MYLCISQCVLQRYICIVICFIYVKRRFRLISGQEIVYDLISKVVFPKPVSQTDLALYEKRS